MSSRSAAAAKSTASDNKKKEDVEDCKCSSATVDAESSAYNRSINKTQQQQLQQNQKLNLFENNSKKATTAFKSNLTTETKEKVANIELDEHAHATDSGFLSGEQSCSFHDDQVEKNSADDPSSASNKQQTYGKTLEEKCIVDSGCIEEEEFIESDIADANNDFQLRIQQQSNSQQQQPQQQPKNPKTFSASNKTRSAEQMIIKHDFDAAISERFCCLSLQSGNNINNLNTTTEATAITGPASLAVASNLPPWEQYYQQNDEGDTYLHLACLSGEENVVAALLRLAIHPCLLNIQNDDGQTPLHLAAISKQRRILRMLLLAGAEPTIRDCRGNTALHLACISGDEQCVCALTIPFSASEINEAHRQYGYRSNDKLVSSLSYARLPSDLEIRNYNGERCVHLAAQAGYIKILSILVQHGADINAREGRSGRTPLHISIENCNEELAYYLLDDCKKKLNLETATFAGLTAYQFACLLNKSQMQNILKNGGAEPLTPPDSDYDSSDIESDLEESKNYDRYGDPGYFANYKGGSAMPVAFYI